MKSFPGFLSYTITLVVVLCVTWSGVAKAQSTTGRLMELFDQMEEQDGLENYVTINEPKRHLPKTRSTSGTQDRELQQTWRLGEVGDYFPIQEGTRWGYKITLGQIEPLCYSKMAWAFQGRHLSIGSRRPYRRPSLQDGDKPFMLDLRVKGVFTKQGSSQSSQTAEIEIKRDELGVFTRSKQVFWEVDRSGRFTVTEVVIYPPDASGAEWMREDVTTRKFLFFGEKTGIELGFGKNPSDTLLLIGADSQVPECHDLRCVHFVRTIRAFEGKGVLNPLLFSSHLHKSFTEDLWFAKGKGLVRLEQKIEGQVSMVCSLDSFSLGVR